MRMILFWRGKLKNLLKINMLQVILASQSKQRKILMETLHIPFKVMPADIDEKAITGTDEAHRVKNIALAKAQTIQRKHPDAIIVAADSCVEVNRVVLEKPESISEARQMLAACSGRWVIGYTGFAFLQPGIEPTALTVASKALFRELSSNEIDRYVAHNPVLTWAGAFSPAYAEGAALLLKVEGSLTGFTHGFPMEELIPRLQQAEVLA